MIVGSELAHLESEILVTRTKREFARLQLQIRANLDWLTQNIEHFVPYQNGCLVDAGVKAFAEFTVAYGCLKRWESRAFTNDLQLERILPIWHSFILRHCENPIYAEMSRKRPFQAFPFLLPYLVLRSESISYRSSYYEDTLSFLHRSGYPGATEVVPYRLLDQQYFLWKSGYLISEPKWEHLYQNTALARSQNLVYIDQDAAYSITHTIFYLTDFGARPAPLNVIDVERAKSIVNSLLIHYWRLSNWDLVGELLINTDCLGLRESPFYAGAASAFRCACYSNGAVPANHNATTKLRSLRGSKRTDMMFRLCYHTTLVSLMHCVIALRQF